VPIGRHPTATVDAIPTAAVDPIKGEVAAEDCPEQERSARSHQKTNSVYHVMNRTCIHLKIEGPNIYMHIKEKIYKELPEGIQK
jgi:hypothetical protein